MPNSNLNNPEVIRAASSSEFRRYKKNPHQGLKPSKSESQFGRFSSIVQNYISKKISAEDFSNRLKSFDVDTKSLEFKKLLQDTENTVNIPQGRLISRIVKIKEVAKTHRKLQSFQIKPINQNSLTLDKDQDALDQSNPINLESTSKRKFDNIQHHTSSENIWGDTNAVWSPKVTEKKIENITKSEVFSNEPDIDYDSLRKKHETSVLTNTSARNFLQHDGTTKKSILAEFRPKGGVKYKNERSVEKTPGRFSDSVGSSTGNFKNFGSEGDFLKWAGRRQEQKEINPQPANANSKQNPNTLSYSKNTNFTNSNATIRYGSNNISTVSSPNNQRLNTSSSTNYNKTGFKKLIKIGNSKSSFSTVG